MKYSATIELLEQKVCIKLDDSHSQGGNLKGREKYKEFEMRDVLSAQIDEKDKKVLHIWTFQRVTRRTGCCITKQTRERVLEVITVSKIVQDFNLVGVDERKTEEWAMTI